METLQSKYPRTFCFSSWPSADRRHEQAQNMQWCLGATRAGGVCWEGFLREATLLLVRRYLSILLQLWFVFFFSV